MRALSLGYLTLPDANAPALVEAAAAASFDVVGLRVGGRRSADTGAWAAHDDRLLRDVRRALDATGVRVESVSAYQLTAETTVAEFAPVFSSAVVLGAPLVCVSTYDADEKRAADTLAALADEAGAHGLRLALEFVPYSQVRTMDAALRVLADVAPARAGIVVDFLHFMRGGGKPADLALVPAERFCFAQICDGPALAPPAEALATEARTDRRFPGDGAFPIPRILAALPPGLTLEIEVPSAAMRSWPPDQQARVSGERVRRYLAEHDVTGVDDGRSA